MSWYLSVLKKYAVFQGRARRMEYWMFVLINMIIAIALLFIDMAIGTFNEEAGVGILYSIYTLGVLLPSISVLVRRLHDTDRTGWWFWICLIPLVGAIWLLVLLVLDGTAGNNRYGEDPKGIEPAAEDYSAQDY